jgi:hypothetical protein
MFLIYFSVWKLLSSKWKYCLDNVLLSGVPYAFQEYVLIVCDFGHSDIEKIY